LGAGSEDSLTDREIVRGTIVALDGEFDLAQRQRVNDAFEAVADESLVVLDLERTLYVDSTVLSCLIRLRADLSERGGKLALVGARPTVRRLFDVAGLTPLFDLRSTIDEVRERYGLTEDRLRVVRLVADES
jgi:anti-sigma B factor antagonist